VSRSLQLLRRLGVAAVGAVTILIGIVLLFLPGPGTVVIVAGLAILGSEFERPRRWVQSLREKARAALQR
jgi:hypothetical protein